MQLYNNIKVCRISHLSYVSRVLSIKALSLKIGVFLEAIFHQACQIKTGEHRDDFNFNLLSSRCHAAS